MKERYSFVKERYIEAGKIVGTHGIKGELKLEAWADSPAFIQKQKKLYFDKGQADAGLVSSRVHKGQLLITLNGVNDPTGGDKLRGRVVYMDKEQVRLPKNRYFIADLIGLAVYDGETGKYYGRLTEVFQTGANNVYRIVEGEKEFLFPAVDHMIKSTDLEAGRLEVLPIPGIFDGEGEEIPV